MQRKPIIEVLLATALLALAAQVAVPLPGALPFTLQTLVLLGAACILGPVRAVAAVALYLLLGGSGLPVFAQGGSGWEKFAGPSGGFLMGFPVAAFVAGVWAQNSRKMLFWQTLACFLAGHGIILAFGGVGLLLTGKSGEATVQTLLVLLPGMAVKSGAGAGILWAVQRLRRKK